MADAAKKASKWRRCVSLSGDPTHESSMKGNVGTFETVQSAVHHALKSARVRQSKKRHKKVFKEAEWRDDPPFWDVCGSDRDLVVTLDKVDF